MRSHEPGRRWLLVLSLAAPLVACSDSEVGHAVATTTPTVPPTTTAPATTGVPTTTTRAGDGRAVLPETVRGGSTGNAVVLVQRRLDELGFLVGGPDGRFGPRTEQAVWAFKKLLLGRRPAELADDPSASDITPQIWVELRDAPPVEPRRDVDGTHVEIYLPEQTLAVFDNGSAVMIAHISSGDGASWCEPVTYDTDSTGAELDEPIARRECGVGITPGGVFVIGVHLAGPRHTPIGVMVEPVYFNHGIAVHGADKLPLLPSTRGSVAIAPTLAGIFPNLVERGDPVFVWGADGREPEDYAADESLPVFNSLDPECLVGTYALQEDDTRPIVAAKFDITETELNAANVETAGYLEFQPGLQIIIPPKNC